MVNKTISCINCEHHRLQAIMYRDILRGMIKKVPKSELTNILLDMKILKKDYVTDKITMKDKCKCGGDSIGYIGLTGMKEEPVYQKYFDKLNSQNN